MTITPVNLRHPDKIYIDGRWCATNKSRTVDVIAAHDETLVYSIAEADEADVQAAVQAARAAFDSGPWPRLTTTERAHWMIRMADAFERRAAEFATIWTVESGILHSISSARVGSLLAGPFRTFASYADTFPFTERHRTASGFEAQLAQEPIGVVAAIVPWNGPAGLMAQKCAPALIAGCTLIVKPSPEAPGAAYLFAEICDELGLPPGVVNVLCADRNASEALVRNPGVDKVTFTGSTIVGRAIASACGDRIARVTLELGGKSPAIILNDFDIAVAAKTIAAGCGFLTGQVCHSLTRIIVQQDRHDDMVQALAAEVEAMIVGDPFDPRVSVGPLATARQRDTVESFIARAIAEGAQLAAGGIRPGNLSKGFFIRPTVFGSVDNQSTLGQQEVFGPVLGVIPAETQEHAVAIANDSIFGLNASIFTNDHDRFITMARQLRCGTVGQNASRTDASISFGGFKQSGIGREGGFEGLRAFLEPKLIVEDRPYV